MSAITSMFEAALGPATELSCEHELVRSPGNCGTLEPRWWVVDVGVRSRVVDTTVSAVARPGASEFKSSSHAPRAPLHLRLRAGLLDAYSGSEREWLLDASSTRTYVFASSVTVYLAGPESLLPYKKGGGKSLSVERDVFCQLRAGVWPCDPVPGPLVRGCACSIRVQVPAGDDVAVPIPPGARTLAIFDSSGSSSPWTWQLGEPAVERRGRIMLVDGQTPAPALVPNFSHVSPALRFGEDRDVLLVFGVDL
jgi:hypothetical protein